MANEEKLYCWDCGKEIALNGQDLVGAKLLKYKEENNEHIIIKCDECFKKNPSLTDYQPCEVYSRIVGYLRPVNQWNPGKQEEYKDRKNYNVK